MREAPFAGYFYPKSESALRKAIEDSFQGERGPGSLPPRKQERKVVAAIAPHAGYQYSGQCAAWTYHAIAASPRPDLFIILGPNHNSMESGTTTETWQTPLGMVRADQEFVKGLVAKGNIALDDEIMAREHSIEVQLPFLQYVVGEEKLKICPILLSDDVDLAKLALDIKETLVEQKKRAIIVASSDFTHHGPEYHYVRFSQDTAQQLYDFDGQMLEFIKGLDAKGFSAFVEKELATVCGAKAIELLLRIVKRPVVKVEQYYTSGDLAKNYKNSVSYAAVVFEER